MRSVLKVLIAVTALALPATALGASGRTLVTLSDPRACPGQSHLGFVRAAFSFPDGRPPFFVRRMTLLCP